MNPDNSNNREVPGKSRKSLIYYKKIVMKLLEYFDSLGILTYYRVDIQNNIDKSKGYFLSAAIRVSNTPVYFASFIVKTKDEIYLNWLNTFLERINSLANDGFVIQQLEPLRSKTISELEVKMGILGI